MRISSELSFRFLLVYSQSGDIFACHSGVDPRGQILLHSDAAQQFNQLLTLLRRQALRDFGLVTGGYLHYRVEHPPAAFRKKQPIRSTVSGTAASLEQTGALQLVDQCNHSTRRYLHGRAKSLL